LKKLSETPSWSKALANAKASSNAASIVSYMTKHLSKEADDEKLKEALSYARAQTDYTVLIAVLEHAQTSLRADALGTVLDIIDEQNPLFLELMSALREGERNLILGALLETYQLDPDPERRLLKLKRLLEGMPRAGRSLYWSEAQTLAEQGGDDAQLILLGLARQLPTSVLPATLRSLRKSIRQVDNIFKRTMAFVALAEMAPLNDEDLSEAKRSAELIPDASLRAMALARLKSL
jgi:hypothetical protein